MFINIGEKIKNLRTNRGLTQDKFAQFLGVNCRDVIKWESGNGYPDFELIPIIANYFMVSTDELMCMEQFSNEERVREFINRFEECMNNGQLPRAIETIREGLVHFPNNYTLKYMLLYSLYLSCDRPAALKHYSGELIDLAEDILSNCTDDAIRLEAKRVLSLHYYEDLKDTKRAQAIVATLPGRIISREDMLPLVSEGEEKVLHIQENIKAYINALNGSIYELTKYDQSLTLEQKITLFELSVKYIEMLYPNGDYNAAAADLLSIHRDIAVMNMSAGNPDKALEHLEKAALLALKYDSYEAVTAHTSPLVNRTESVKSRNDGRTMCETFAKEVLPMQCFESIRYAPKMQIICDIAIKGIVPESMN